MSLFVLPPNARSNASTRSSVGAPPRTRLRVLVAEHDRATRLKWLAAVAVDTRFELVGVASNGAEALNRIERLAPDVVIMAMHMPRLHGREVVEALGGTSNFELILTSSPLFTGVRALHLNARDHVDQPADSARMTRALDRAHAHAARRTSAQRDACAAHDCRELTVKTSDGRWHTLGTDEIVRITAKQGYARIEATRGVFVVRTTLRELASRLGAQFVWRSRSEIAHNGARAGQAQRAADAPQTARSR